jgi:hypothetical protein
MNHGSASFTTKIQRIIRAKNRPSDRRQPSVTPQPVMQAYPGIFCIARVSRVVTLASFQCAVNDSRSTTFTDTASQAYINNTIESFRAETLDFRPNDIAQWPVVASDIWVPTLLTTGLD